MTSKTDFLKSYECLKKSFRQTMEEVDTAFSDEDSKDPLKAIVEYQRVLKLIDETLQIRVKLPHKVKNIKCEWYDACNMIEKLKSRESEIEYRIKVLRSEIAYPAHDASQQVSKQIVTVSDSIARSLIKGAEKTGEFMVESTPYIISQMDPAPADAPPVSLGVETTVEVAKIVTSAAVSATGWFAGIVGSASMAIGHFLAPHIQAQGEQLLETDFGYSSEEAKIKMESAMTIAAGAIEGISNVYVGLETSAKILGNSLSDNSVKIIEHKYGPSVANVAAGTFDTIGNTLLIRNNVKYMAPKGMARNINGNKKDLSVETSVPAGVLNPDLKALKAKYMK